MSVFLEQLARTLLEHHPEGLGRVAVVLPGRRAGAALRMYLGELHGRAQWSPDLLDMAGLMQRIAGMRQGSPLEMLAHLYQVHHQLAGPRAETFDAMLQWAPVTLNDMSEVDAHLLDLDAFYRALEDIDDLEQWSFRLGELSPGQQRMAHRWRDSGALHRAMHVHMRQVSVGTSGMVARVASEQATEAMVPWTAVWFVGQIDPTPAAMQVAAGLRDRGLAHFAWDADRYWLDDPAQEAGTHLRKAIAAFGPGAIPPTDRIREAPRTILSSTLPNDLAQVLYAAEHLARSTPEEQERTSIVLADEHLLMPLLGSLPDTLRQVRVTMGVRMEALPANSLMQTFLRIHQDQGSSEGLALLLLEQLLRHPMVHATENTAALLARLHARGSPRVPVDHRQASIASMTHSGTDIPWKALLPVTDPVAELPARVNDLLAWVRERNVHDAWAQEQLYQLAGFQARLHRALQLAQLPPMSMRSYISIRQRLLRTEVLDVSESRSQGARVGTMNDTAAMTRPIILVLGAREGLVPPAEMPQSWIPHDIRRQHGLTLMEDVVGRSAYGIHQLLQHAEQLHLVHAQGANGGDATRFLAQWEHDLVGHGATSIQRSVLTVPVPARHPGWIAVQKQGATAHLLESKARQGWSPSALGDWLQCPLDHYFRHVLGIRTGAAADGRLTSDVLGSEVHATLEDIYRPWLGQALTGDQLAQAAQRVHHMVLSRAARQWSQELVGQGHYRLRLEMAARALERYLLAEADQCARRSTVPLALELPVRAMLPNGVALHGRCDRVELRDGVVHILDMKTGDAKPDQMRLPGTQRSDFTADRRFGVQLLIYAWAYLEQHPEVERVRAAIIPLRRSSASDGQFLHLAGSEDLTRDHLAGIASGLADLVDEISAPGTPLMHDPKSPYCAICTQVG